MRSLLQLGVKLMTMFSRASITDELTAYIAATLQIDITTPDELAGATAIANAVVDFFGVLKPPAGAERSGTSALSWLVTSAILDGKVPQERIDAAFSALSFDMGEVVASSIPSEELSHLRAVLIPKTVNIDGLSRAIRQFGDEPCSVVVVPGKLTEATIGTISQALYAQLPQDRQT